MVDDFEVVNSNPPNIDQVDLKFKVKNEKGIIYAYGGKIYNPSGLTIPKHLLVHEGVHLFRQGRDSDRWWESYINNPVFRLDEEIYAHRAEWGQYVKENLDRNVRAKYFHFMCQRLSGPLYDNMITFAEARKRLSS